MNETISPINQACLKDNATTSNSLFNELAIDNQVDEEEFGEYHNDSIRKINLAVSLITIFFDLCALYFTFKLTNINLIGPLIINSLSIVINVTILFILNKTVLYSKWNKLATYGRIFYICRVYFQLFLIATSSTQVLPARVTLFIRYFNIQIFILSAIYLTNIYISSFYGYLMLLILISTSIVGIVCGESSSI